jgi:anaerobic nitric oxide reductase transcription regulator
MVPHGMVGESAPMLHLRAQIRAFAAMPWPALVLGETGSGKEAVARALHAGSPRASSPFVAINCASVPDELAESTFFGHERGAFTGAERRREGLLERVGTGTLFLDEIGELSPRIQAKLLRVFQEGVYTRVGGDQELRFTGRIVAATHRELLQEGAFRADLYHRLSTFVLRVPALRERREDIPDLARFLLARASAQVPGAAGVTLSSAALDLLAQQAWAGNVRELENTLRAGIALALALGCDVIEPAYLGLVDVARPMADLGLIDATEAFQRSMVERVVAANAGNKTRAARELGVSRQWLHGLLARWEEAPRRVDHMRVAARGRMSA